MYIKKKKKKSILYKTLISATLLRNNSLYSIEHNFKEVKTILKTNFELLQGWFYENHTFLNPGKYQYLVINKDIANESIELGEKILLAEAEQKLLGIITDKDLNFQSHTKSIIKTANQKLCLHQSRTVYD